MNATHAKSFQDRLRELRNLAQEAQTDEDAQTAFEMEVRTLLHPHIQLCLQRRPLLRTVELTSVEDFVERKLFEKLPGLAIFKDDGISEEAFHRALFAYTSRTAGSAFAQVAKDYHTLEDSRRDTTRNARIVDALKGFESTSELRAFSNKYLETPFSTITCVILRKKGRGMTYREIFSYLCQRYPMPRLPKSVGAVRAKFINTFVRIKRKETKSS